MLWGLRLLVLAVHWLAPTSAWSVLNAVLCSLLFQTYFFRKMLLWLHTQTPYLCLVIQACLSFQC